MSDEKVERTAYHTRYGYFYIDRTYVQVRSMQAGAVGKIINKMLVHIDLSSDSNWLTQDMAAAFHVWHMSGYRSAMPEFLKTQVEEK